MLTEYLKTRAFSVETDWQSVMPGVLICKFRLTHSEETATMLLSPRMDRERLEAVYCQEGSMVLGQKGKPLSLWRQEVLLLAGCSEITSVRLSAPFTGILVSVDQTQAGERFSLLGRTLGGLEDYVSKVEQWLMDASSYVLPQTASWTRAVFSVLDILPVEEQGRYCLLKTVELLYLLSNHGVLLAGCVETPCPNSPLSYIVAEIHTYMEEHLEEKLTIDAMSRQFHISPTAFKSCFRRLYGQPVHRWLQGVRLQRASELLAASSMSVLQIAELVGYEGVSQFNVAFKNRFCVTPREYRKMSKTEDF